MVKPTNARMGPRWLGLLLLWLCVTIVSCATKTADPQAKLGDVYVKDIYCNDGTRSVSSTVPVSFLVSVSVDGVLTESKVCWAGIYRNLPYGDDVGAFIVGRSWVFTTSSQYLFSVDVEEGIYMVVVGMANALGDEYNVSAAEQKQGPYRTAAGGPGCANPPKLAKIEYSCMAGYDLRGPSDTTAVSNMYRYARRRFDDGNVKLDFAEYDLNIPADTFSSDYLLRQFLYSYWEMRFYIGLTTQDFFLAGIKNCTNRLHFYGNDPRDSLPESALGLSRGYQSGGNGRPGAQSVVFRGYADSVFCSTPQEASNHLTVHELGHSLFDLTDVWRASQNHDGGVDANCVMNKIVLQSNGAIHPSRSKFCYKCDSIISNYVWPTKK